MALFIWRGYRVKLEKEGKKLGWGGVKFKNIITMDTLIWTQGLNFNAENWGLKCERVETYVVTELEGDKLLHEQHDCFLLCPNPTLHSPQVGVPDKDRRIAHFVPIISAQYLQVLLGIPLLVGNVGYMYVWSRSQTLYPSWKKKTQSNIWGGNGGLNPPHINFYSAFFKRGGGSGNETNVCVVIQ